MSNPNFTELVTATLNQRRPKIADAITNHNGFMNELRRRGRIKPVPGGTSITAPLMIGEENTNFMWYQGREALKNQGQEVLTSAEFAWKQYAVGVSMSGLEMLQNSGGRTQIYNMLAKRIEHAEKTIANQMGKSAHGNGTASGGKEFGGLALLISQAAGATVAGINSANDTWWDNQREATGAAPDVSTIFPDMLNLWLKLQRGMDKANLITADNVWYTTFVNSLQAQQRFSDAKLARAGFTNVMFQTAPIIPDGGMNGQHPSGMRFINLDTIELCMHKDRNNVVLDGPSRPLLEDSETVLMAGMGNFVCDNRMLNGVLHQ